jgi:hypothetical protein
MEDITDRSGLEALSEGKTRRKEGNRGSEFRLQAKEGRAFVAIGISRSIISCFPDRTGGRACSLFITLWLHTRPEPD